MRIAGLAGLCAATLVAPALLLVWMPIVLGVPHIASDIRYLVLPLPRRQVVVALAACAALVALKATSLASGVPLLRVEMAVVAAWLLVALALARPGRRAHVLLRHGARAHRGSRGWLVATFAALLIIALPLQFAIVAAFAHNAVAVIAWLVVRRPERRHAYTVIATILAAVALLLLAGPWIASATGGDATRWLTIDRAASLMFGGVPLPAARALMIAFAFLQAVHYAIWLDWIPRGAGVMRSATPSVSLGRVGAMAAMAGTALVLGAALVDPAWTRTTYLALATFHIYLELVVLAAMAMRRRT